MISYKFNPDFISNISNDKLIIISVLNDRNEVYEFVGKNSELIKYFINTESFDLKSAERFLAEPDITDDLKNFFDFCEQEKIILKK